jgi:hypothetical protein
VAQFGRAKGGPMLSVQECRAILGKECQLSDSEIEQLIEQLYGLADVSLASFYGQLRRNNSSKPSDQG